MKYLFIISILILTFSCCKTDPEIVITETDKQGNIIKGDTNTGKFAIWVIDTNEAGNKVFFKENTLGFMPFKQNCNDIIKLYMYPNPMTGNDTLRYKINSSKNLLAVWYWPNDGSSMFGGNLSIPTKLVDEEYGGLLVNGQRTDNKTMLYHFMVATTDSCVYKTTWQVVKK